jgi:hypothetical protein
MKDYDYYAMKGVSYPTKTQFTTVFVYKTGRVVWQGAMAEFDACEKDLKSAGMIEKSVDEDAYKTAMASYHVQQQKRSIEFFTDLCEEHGVTGNPKADKVYQLAYDYGHSVGHQEVAGYFAQLAEIIKD